MNHYSSDGTQLQMDSFLLCASVPMKLLCYVFIHTVHV